MIINQTRQKNIASIVFFADNPIKRMQGLLGKSNLGVGEAMVIKPCNAIHTFFMRFPIDVLFVDKHNKVVKAISNLPAFRLTSICFASQFVVELPSGTIKATHTVSGDQLTVGY